MVRLLLEVFHQSEKRCRFPPSTIWLSPVIGIDRVVLARASHPTGYRMVDERNPGIWKRRTAGLRNSLAEYESCEGTAVFSGNRLSSLE